jgi:hypothetical protein
MLRRPPCSSIQFMNATCRKPLRLCTETVLPLRSRAVLIEESLRTSVPATGADESYIEAGATSVNGIPFTWPPMSPSKLPFPTSIEPAITPEETAAPLFAAVTVTSRPLRRKIPLATP